MNKIICGDAIEEMKKLPENSVDAIITDPPYGLEFMGKEWDKFKQGENIAGGTTGIGTPFGRSKLLSSAYQYSLKEKNALQQFCFSWAKECLRVLKPGGYLLSFGGTRTYHRMACGVEDAGFEIRDKIDWIYGSGFPKSLDVGRNVDRVYCTLEGKHFFSEPSEIQKKKFPIWHICPYTKEGYVWRGVGTALKPACEPIVVARKPLSEKNVALNVLKYGTGGMNIDESRISLEGEKQPLGSAKRVFKSNQYTDEKIYGDNKKTPEQGRFPANIIFECICDKTEQGQEKISGGFGAMDIGMSDTGKGITQKYDKTKSKSKENKFMIHTNPNCPCYMLDEQSGDVTQGHWSKSKVTGFGDFGGGTQEYFGVGEKDKTKHGASRFFYCAKASKSERNFGCEDMEQKDSRKEDGSAKSLEIFSNQYTESSGNPTGRGITSKRANNHPTVKPIKLMEYLIKLVSREGSVILDPFIGSGTTAIACLKLNRNCIGIEKEEEYVKIANARIKPFLEQSKLN